MKLEATRLAEAQRCEICVVMLKDVEGVLQTFRIEEKPHIVDGIQPIETFVEYESATGFKGFEALHNNVLDIYIRLIALLQCSNGSRTYA